MIVIELLLSQKKRMLRFVHVIRIDSILLFNNFEELLSLVDLEGFHTDQFMFVGIVASSIMTKLLGEEHGQKMVVVS